MFRSLLRLLLCLVHPKHCQSFQMPTSYNEKKEPSSDSFLISGGSRIRTYDLWVMSPTSYLCSIPRCFVYVCKGSNFFIHLQIFRHLFSRIPLSFIITTCSTLYYALKFFHRCFRRAPHTRLKSRTRQLFTPTLFLLQNLLLNKKRMPVSTNADDSPV